MGFISIKRQHLKQQKGYICRSCFLVLQMSHISNYSDTEHTTSIFPVITQSSLLYVLGAISVIIRNLLHNKRETTRLNNYMKQ